jgi:hypothetical protein
MGFLDKAKDAANKAADKAKQATAVGKEKIEDVQLNKKISKAAEEIGRLVVAQRRNEAPADADAQIDAKVAEIADLEAQIEANNVSSNGDAAEAEAAPAEPAASETTDAPA